MHDLLNARETLADVHTGHTGEVEGLERHLRRGLAKGLRGNHTARRAGLAHLPRVLLGAQADELGQTLAGDLEKLVGPLLTKFGLVVVDRRHIIGVGIEAQRLPRLNQLVDLLLAEPAQLLQEERAAATEVTLPQKCVHNSAGLERQQRGFATVAIAGNEFRVHNLRPQRLEVERATPEFHLHRVEAVLAVAELDDATRGVRDSVVILHDKVLKALHDLSGEVPCVGGLHSGIDETLATTHGVEEELRRRETRVETVLNEAARNGLASATGEVGRRALDETVANALSGHSLLSDARDHLSNVDRAALTAAQCHNQRRVGVVKRADAHLTALLTNRTERTVQDGLNCLLRSAPGGGLELALVELLDELICLCISIGDDAVLLRREAEAGRDIIDADAKAVVHEPAGRQTRHLGHALGGVIDPSGLLEVEKEGVLRTTAHDLLVQAPGDELTVEKGNVAVLAAHVANGVLAATSVVPRLGTEVQVYLDVLVGLHQHLQHLLPAPQLDGLDDTRMR
eukprot:PhM_4_TR7299/c0_g1_i1/m.686